MKNHLVIICAVLVSSIAIGQSTWYQILSGTTKKLNAIDFPNDSAGYIAGNDSTLLFSWDDGTTWTQMSLNGITFSNGNDDIIDVEFFATGDGYIVIDQGGVYKTTNSGLNWTPVTGQTSNMCFPNTLFLFNMGKFLVGGGGCFEGAIIDQFENSAWSTANLGMNFWNSEHVVQEMSFSSSVNGLAATKSEYILKTIDGGYNWDTISTGISGFLTSIEMVNDTLCFAGYDENGGGNGILKSVDGGLTWEQDVTSATFYYPTYTSVFSKTDFLSGNIEVFSGAIPYNGSGGLIFELSGSTNWTSTEVNQPINDITAHPSFMFAVGDSGYLVVNAPVADLETLKSESISFEVFPNPVQNTLTFENPYSESMEVKMLDFNGRCIRNEVLEPGFSSISCTDLVNGMYFIQATLDGSVGVKRIVKE